MGSRNSQLRGKQIQNSSAGDVSFSSDAANETVNNGTANIKSLKYEQNNNSNSNINNNNDNDDVEMMQEALSHQKALRAATSENGNQSDDTQKAKSNTINGTSVLKGFNLQDRASNFAQRIRRSSSIKKLFPTFVSGKRKASAESNAPQQSTEEVAAQQNDQTQSVSPELEKETNEKPALTENGATESVVNDQTEVVATVPEPVPDPKTSGHAAEPVLASESAPEELAPGPESEIPVELSPSAATQSAAEIAPEVDLAKLATEKSAVESDEIKTNLSGEQPHQEESASPTEAATAAEPEKAAHEELAASEPAKPDTDVPQEKPTETPREAPAEVADVTPEATDVAPVANETKAEQAVAPAESSSNNEVDTREPAKVESDIAPGLPEQPKDVNHEETVGAPVGESTNTQDTTIEGAVATDAATVGDEPKPEPINEVTTSESVSAESVAPTEAHIPEAPQESEQTKTEEVAAPAVPTESVPETETDPANTVPTATETPSGESAEPTNAPAQEHAESPSGALADAAPVETPADAAPVETPADAAPVETPGEAAPAEALAETTPTVAGGDEVKVEESADGPKEQLPNADENESKSAQELQEQAAAPVA